MVGDHLRYRTTFRVNLSRTVRQSTCLKIEKIVPFVNIFDTFGRHSALTRERSVMPIVRN